MSAQTSYVFAEGRDEERRLMSQATVLDPLTERLFARAGLAPGMKVLDLGSGAGNVAAIAAHAVGPHGRVVGVDRDPERVRAARDGAGPTMEFREADVTDLEGFEDDFDAVVGRAVLMHLGDPAGALRTAAGHVRPGGLLCMHEPDMTYLWTSEETPLWQQVRAWILDIFHAGGVNAQMGPSLFAAYRSAGLPDPEMTLEAPIGGGSNAPTFGWANILGGLLPVAERLGVVTAAEVHIETLVDRLDGEMSAVDGTVMGPPMYGAWCSTPA